LRRVSDPVSPPTSPEPSVQAPPVPDRPSEKERWETAKLKAEAEQITHPFRKNPTVWFSLLTVLIATVGVGIQCAASRAELRLAQIEVARAELRLDSLHRSKRQLDSVLAVTQATYAELSTKLTQVQETLQVRLKAVADAQKRFREVDSTGVAATSPAARSRLRQAQQALTQANKSLGALAAFGHEAAATTAQAQENLQALRGELKGAAPTGSALRIGLPVRVSLELSHRSRVRWWRVQAPNPVYTAADSAGPGVLTFQIPYPGSIWVEAVDLSDSTSLEKPVDCSRRATCSAQF
jgi:hypothetical protein